MAMNTSKQMDSNINAQKNEKILILGGASNAGK
jgi:hypothetical protein